LSKSETGQRSFGFYNHRNIKGIFLEYSRIRIFRDIWKQGAMNYFWTIHEQILMLVAIVPTFCVTWDKSKAASR
jgi:hypothetical protein